MLKKIFNVKGLNIWLLGTAIGLNLVWIVLLMTLTKVIGDAALPADPPEWLILVITLGTFIGPFLIAIGISAMARDLRDLSYGVLGSLGGVALVLVVVFPANPEFGIIMLGMAVLGGFNGGLFSLRRSQ